MNVFAIRDKRTQELLGVGSLKKTPRVYGMKNHASSSLTHILEGYFYRRDGVKRSDFEIVEYELVEVASHEA